MDQYCFSGAFALAVARASNRTIRITDVIRQNIMTIVNVVLGLLATLGIIESNKAGQAAVIICNKREDPAGILLAGSFFIHMELHQMKMIDLLC